MIRLHLATLAMLLAIFGAVWAFDATDRADAVGFAYPAEVHPLEGPAELIAEVGIPANIDVKLTIDTDASTFILSGPELPVTVTGSATVEGSMTMLFGGNLGNTTGYDAEFLGSATSSGFGGQYTLFPVDTNISLVYGLASTGTLPPGDTPTNTPPLPTVTPGPGATNTPVVPNETPSGSAMLTLEKRERASTPGDVFLFGWGFRLYEDPGCQGLPFQDAITVTVKLAPASYSVEEIPRAGWGPISETCQNVVLANGANETVTFENARLDGDVTLDGATDSRDSVIILQITAGQLELNILDILAQVRADINQEDGINAIDASLILQYEAGYLEELGMLPDLVVTALAPIDPGPFSEGYPLLVEDTTCNSGSVATGSSLTGYTIFGDSDIELLGTRSVPPLNPGSCSTESVVVEFPIVHAGEYTIHICADLQDVEHEQSEDNNCLETDPVAYVQ